MRVDQADVMRARGRSRRRSTWLRISSGRSLVDLTSEALPWLSRWRDGRRNPLAAALGIVDEPTSVSSVTAIACRSRSLARSQASRIAAFDGDCGPAARRRGVGLGRQAERQRLATEGRRCAPNAPRPCWMSSRPSMARDRKASRTPGD